MASMEKPSGAWRSPSAAGQREGEGLTLRDTGETASYVAGGGKLNHSRDIHIKDVVCDNNYRQGISVISVDGLLVEDSRFNNTWGTPPSFRRGPRTRFRRTS